MCWGIHLMLCNNEHKHQTNDREIALANPQAVLSTFMYQCLHSCINNNCGINILRMNLSTQFLDDSFLYDGLSHSSGIEHP